MSARKPLAFHLDADSALTLQGQIRQKIVGAISSGALPCGSHLPSTRALADQLGVARNTVVLAYQQLIADGILAGRERSGIFVGEAITQREAVAAGDAAPPPSPWGRFDWGDRLAPDLPEPEGAGVPANWSQYPYPFIDGVFDHSLFPITEWREASRLSLGVREVDGWSACDPERDDPDFLARLRSLLLQRHGIHAESDEILLTCSVRAALFIAASLVVGAGDPVLVEDPGSPQLRQLLQHLGAEVRFQPVDGEGLVVDGAFRDCRALIVSPSFHFPTNATMPAARRRELLAAAREAELCVIEFDADGELNPPEEALPTLRGLDRDGRVIRVGGLNAILGPALRMGVLVAPSPVIARARKIRALIGAAPVTRDQRASLHFLALGHYDAAMARLAKALGARRRALIDALDHYLPQSITMLPLRNGTAAWIQGPKGIEAPKLAEDAARRGILIEPAATWFADRDDETGLFRMSITSLPLARIRPGVAALAEVIRDHLGGRIERLDLAEPVWLTGQELTARMAGATLLCRTNSSTPCTIDLHADGTMTGIAGQDGEDRDHGTWWVEGDRWFRRWTRWNYGEATGFLTMIRDSEIKWFNQDGRLVDRAAIVWNQLRSNTERAC